MPPGFPNEPAIIDPMTIPGVVDGNSPPPVQVGQDLREVTGDPGLAANAAAAPGRPAMGIILLTIWVKRWCARAIHGIRRLRKRINPFSNELSGGAGLDGVEPDQEPESIKVILVRNGESDLERSACIYDNKYYFLSETNTNLLKKYSLTFKTPFLTKRGRLQAFNYGYQIIPKYLKDARYAGEKKLRILKYFVQFYAHLWSLLN